jgi:hypothetical protein
MSTCQSCLRQRALSGAQDVADSGCRASATWGSAIDAPPPPEESCTCAIIRAREQAEARRERAEQQAHLTGLQQQKDRAKRLQEEALHLLEKVQGGTPSPKERERLAAVKKELGM